MNLDHVFKKTKTALKKRESTTTVPDGLLCRCSRCKKPILVQEVRDAYYICPKCGGYFKVRAYERVRRVADEGTFQESESWSVKIRWGLKDMKKSWQRKD